MGCSSVTARTGQEYVRRSVVRSVGCAVPLQPHTCWGAVAAGRLPCCVVTILAAIFICGAGVAPALAERKIAFVVGIDKYDNLSRQLQLQRADRNTAARQSFLVAATPAHHRRHYMSPPSCSWPCA